MSDYKQFQIIVIALNREDKDDDSITVVRNIAINDDVDRGMLKKAIERAINDIEDEL